MHVLQFLQSVSPILLALSAAVSAIVAVIAYRHSRKTPKNSQKRSIQKAKSLIAKNEVKKALDYLLSEIRNSSVEKDLIHLKQQWVDFERRRDLGMIKPKKVPVISARLLNRILSIIDRIEKPIQQLRNN